MTTYAHRSRNRYGVPLALAVVLHVGLFLLAYVSWITAPKPLAVASVPVELVSSVPMHEQMETPVDPLAVKTPAPEPEVEETPTPEPQPVPAPKMPVPTPQKEVVKPAPKAAPTPPDKTGMKAPQPQKPKAEPKPALDLDNLAAQMAAQAAKSKTRTPAQASTRPTNGNSTSGGAPADAGTQTAITALTQRLQRLWNPSCDVPGFNTVHPDIRFSISPNGRVVQGPDWTNPRNDPIWEAAASRAKSAVKRGELYDDLPKELFNRPLVITFDGHSACG